MVLNGLVCVVEIWGVVCVAWLLIGLCWFVLGAASWMFRGILLFGGWGFDLSHRNRTFGLWEKKRS